MPIPLKFYRDQFVTTGESSSPLPAAHRLIYIRYGSVIANGATLTQDQFAYHHDPLSLQGEAELSEIWRWELSAPNETPHLLSGTDTLSLPKLAHVITSLEAEPGTIRGDLAVNIGRNVIHGSDAPETAAFEIGLWFTSEELNDWTPSAQTWRGDS